MNGWAELADREPDRVLLVAYEELKFQPEATVQRMIDFIGVAPKGTIQQSLENTSVDAMRQTAGARIARLRHAGQYPTEA